MPVDENENLDFLAHANQMDIRRMELDAETQRAQINATANVDRARWETRKTRWVTLQAWGISLLAVVAVLGIAYIVWQANTGPDEDALQEQVREETCQDNGGTWLSKDLLVGESGMCVMPGSDVSQ